MCKEDTLLRLPGIFSPKDEEKGRGTMNLVSKRSADIFEAAEGASLFECLEEAYEYANRHGWRVTHGETVLFMHSGITVVVDADSDLERIWFDFERARRYDDRLSSKGVGVTVGPCRKSSVVSE